MTHPEELSVSYVIVTLDPTLAGAIQVCSHPMDPAVSHCQRVRSCCDVKEKHTAPRS